MKAARAAFASATAIGTCAGLLTCCAHAKPPKEDGGYRIWTTRAAEPKEDGRRCVESCVETAAYYDVVLCALQCEQAPGRGFYFPDDYFPDVRESR
jgi:hypothetical protein